MPLFHEFAARLPQSDSANEKQGEPKVIAVVLLILLGHEDTRTGIASRRDMRA
jgi:hypothetical protein